jgi:hypothetical protein
MLRYFALTGTTGLYPGVLTDRTAIPPTVRQASTCSRAIQPHRRVADRRP